LPAARAHWPADPSLLPVFLTEKQVAHLMGKSVRTLQKYRREGISIPFHVVGRSILYARDDVLALGAARSA
jgi:hypothetical protein